METNRRGFLGLIPALFAGSRLVQSTTRKPKRIKIRPGTILTVNGKITVNGIPLTAEDILFNKTEG